MKRSILLLLLFLFTFTASALATDVQIGPTTIPGFNAANLPPDVTVTPVSVVNGSPTVTCASCFRQQWVGLGGFRITINTVPYTVAYVTSRSSLTLTTNYAAGDSPSATVLWYKYVELRIYADSSFQPLGKTYIVQPGAPGSGAWHRRVAASVVNEFGVNNLYIPQLTLDATTDSLTNQAARYTAAFYRPEGSLIQFYDCFESFLLAPTGATTWPDICMFNTRQVIVQDDSTYTKTQIDSFRTGCTTGQGLFYAATGLKPACLNFGAGLSLAGDTLNATAPSGYTTVLNNGTPLTQRNNLNFVAPAFIASDNGGATRTDVTVHGNLVSLANLATNGGVYRTAANTLTARTITGTANLITVTDGDGVLGNPTINIGANVATNSNNLSFFAATTSAQLAGVISDESGTGALIFGTSPALTTPTITSPRIVTAINDTNGAALINLTATASAVNQFTAANSATGIRPKLSATGTDTNIGLEFAPKGTGEIVVGAGGDNIARFRVRGNSTLFLFEDIDQPRTAAINLTGNLWDFNNFTGGTNPIRIDLSTDVATFLQIPVLPASNPTTANQAARKQYVDDTTTAWSIGFFEADPATSTLGNEDRAAWIAPDGTSITITKLKIVFWDGSHTTNGVLTYALRKRNSAGAGLVELGTLTLDNTNNTRFVVYTNDIGDVSVSPGDTISFFLSTRTAPITEKSVSIAVIGTQKRIP